MGRVRWVNSTCLAGTDSGRGHSRPHWASCILPAGCCTWNFSWNPVPAAPLSSQQTPLNWSWLRVKPVVCNKDTSNIIPLPASHHDERPEKFFPYFVPVFLFFLALSQSLRLPTKPRLGLEEDAFHHCSPRWEHFTWDPTGSNMPPINIEDQLLEESEAAESSSFNFHFVILNCPLLSLSWFFCTLGALFCESIEAVGWSSQAPPNSDRY